jgi:hypothetical protein
MTAPALPGTTAALVAPGVIVWPTDTGMGDDNVLVPGGLVLTVNDGTAHCITKSDGARARPLGLRHSTLELADIDIVAPCTGEPAAYTRRVWAAIAGELERRQPNHRLIDQWRDLAATLRRL